MADLKNKRIITVATTGAWPKKENNPNVPLQPEEIAEEIYQCWKIGAAVAHVHVRDEEGNDSMKVETFKKVIDLVRENHPDCDIIFNLTAAGGIANSEEARMAPFKTLKPEMASFDCGTMNWMHMGIFNNNPNFLRNMGTAMQEAGVKPEIEVFDPGMIHDAAYYILNVWEQQGFDQEKDELQLTGDKEPRQIITRIAQEYIRQVMPSIFPPQLFKLGKETLEAPFDLTVIPLCEL